MRQDSGAAGAAHGRGTRNSTCPIYFETTTKETVFTPPLCRQTLHKIYVGNHLISCKDRDAGELCPACPEFMKPIKRESEEFYNV